MNARHLTLAAAAAAAALAALGAARPAAAASADERIRRVERGLLPRMVTQGQDPPTMTLADRMRFYHVPAASVALIDGGRVAWTRAYGFADEAARRPATPKTPFQAASLSKPVAAAAALRLAARGALALDEDVNARLRSWKIPDSELSRTEKVTLRRLLSHSAGFNVHGFEGYASTQPLPSLTQILDGRPPANSDPIRLELVPGKEFRYSGGGFTVLQQLLEDVSGLPFPTLLEQLVLRPAGMRDSAFAQPLPAPRLAEAALAYREDGRPVPEGPHVYPELAAAGLWTTPGDLARFLLEVRRSYLGLGGLLPRALARELATRQIEDRGLGFGLAGAGRSLRLVHTGSNEGYKCQLTLYLETGQGIVVMANGDKGRALAEELARAAAVEYGWDDLKPRVLAKVAPAALTPRAGVYAAQDGASYAVAAEDGRLMLRNAALGPDPMELLPESATRFFTLLKPHTFSFDDDVLLIDGALTARRKTATMAAPGEKP